MDQFDEESPYQILVGLLRKSQTKLYEQLAAEIAETRTDSCYFQDLGDSPFELKEHKNCKRSFTIHEARSLRRKLEVRCGVCLEYTTVSEKNLVLPVRAGLAMINLHRQVYGVVNFICDAEQQRVHVFTASSQEYYKNVHKSFSAKLKRRSAADLDKQLQAELREREVSLLCPYTLARVSIPCYYAECHKQPKQRHKAQLISYEFIITHLVKGKRYNCKVCGIPFDNPEGFEIYGAFFRRLQLCLPFSSLRFRVLGDRLVQGARLFTECKRELKAMLENSYYKSQFYYDTRMAQVQCEKIHNKLIVEKQCLSQIDRAIEIQLDEDTVLPAKCLSCKNSPRYTCMLKQLLLDCCSLCGSKTKEFYLNGALFSVMNDPKCRVYLFLPLTNSYLPQSRLQLDCELLDSALSLYSHLDPDKVFLTPQRRSYFSSECKTHRERVGGVEREVVHFVKYTNLREGKKCDLCKVKTQSLKSLLRYCQKSVLRFGAQQLRIDQLGSAYSSLIDPWTRTAYPTVFNARLDSLPRIYHKNEYIRNQRYLKFSGCENRACKEKLHQLDNLQKFSEEGFICQCKKIFFSAEHLSVLQFQPEPQPEAQVPSIIQYHEYQIIDQPIEADSGYERIVFEKQYLAEDGGLQQPSQPNQQQARLAQEDIQARQYEQQRQWREPEEAEAPRQADLAARDGDLVLNKVDTQTRISERQLAQLAQHVARYSRHYLAAFPVLQQQLSGVPVSTKKFAPLFSSNQYSTLGKPILPRQK